MNDLTFLFFHSAFHEKTWSSGTSLHLKWSNSIWQLLVRWKENSHDSWLNAAAWGVWKHLFFDKTYFYWFNYQFLNISSGRLGWKSSVYQLTNPGIARKMCALGWVPTVWSWAMGIIRLSAGFTSCCVSPWDSVILTFFSCRAMLRWPGKGLLFSPNFDSWRQYCVLVQSINLSSELSQEYSLYVPSFCSISLCESTVSIMSTPKSRTRKDTFSILVTQYKHIIHNNYWVNTFLGWR